MKAIALLSGGLDSILATRLIKDQGIELEAVNFLTIFCNCTSRGKTCLASTSAAASLGVGLKVFEVTKEYINIVKAPKHGYGRNLNPCLDCRIFIFRKAGEYMRQSGASFIVTGEVLGERPMSQRMDAMRIIEKESGLKGLIVRPLCAKLMEPTIPEKEGMIDREKLLNIQGRSRKPQIQLASELGIHDYPCPAGGCLLTDSGFAKKIKDLIKHDEFDLSTVQLLKAGRYFRLSKEAKLVVGRQEGENELLGRLSQDNDYFFQPTHINGPSAIGRGVFNPDLIKLSCRIVARYCDREDNSHATISYRKPPLGAEEGSVSVSALGEDELNKLRV